MTSRSSRWWLHVLYLVVLQHTWLSSEEPTPTNETFLNHTTTGHDLVYFTSTKRTKTLNSTLETNSSIVTTRPGVTSIYEDTSRTNITIETLAYNSATVPDLNSTEESPGSTSTSLYLYSSNVTSYEETSGTTYTSLQQYSHGVTSGSDLVSTSKDTTITPNPTLETYSSNVTTDLTSEETPVSTYRTLYQYSRGVTSGSDLVSTTEDTTKTSNPTLETYSSNVTTDLTSTSEETPGTTYTTLQQYSHGVTSGSHLVYTTEDTVGVPNTTPEMDRTSYSGVTEPPDVMYTASKEPATGTPNTTLQTDGAPYFSAIYCLQDTDCPAFTVCTDLGKLHVCQCHLGSYFHDDLGCVTARTFPARIPISLLYWDEISLNTTEHHSNEDEIRHMEAAQYHQGFHTVRRLFQNVLGHIPGYLSTSVSEVESDEGYMTIVHSFSTLYTVTEEDVWGVLTVSPLICSDPRSDCLSPLATDDYEVLSLCDSDICDSSSSECHSHGGLVTCDCRRGYYKYNPTDRSCRACGSGFQWTQDGCERCPIGFGGFNCDESYLVVVIVESCLGCVLLAALITLLVFYFRRKEPQKPMFIDSIVLGVPPDQPSLRLPRAQFSWRADWEWKEPPEKVSTDDHQEAASLDGPVIHMKTFGDPARFSVPNTYHGRHNLSFISD